MGGGQESVDDCTDLWLQISIVLNQGRNVPSSDGFLQVVRLLGDLHSLIAKVVAKL